MKRAYPDEAEFVHAMKTELNRLITGDEDRAVTEKRALEARDRSLKELEDYARQSGNPDKILALIAERFSRDEFKRKVKDWVIETGSRVPVGAPRSTWSDGALGGSSMTPDFDFGTQPRWDHDDCAEYCVSEMRKESHCRVLIRWLAHQWAVKRVPEAKSALVKAFQPLVRSLVGRYASTGRREVGQGYHASGTEVLNGALQILLEDFDFFYKKIHRAGELRWRTEDLSLRESGYVTSDFELPITRYLERKLEDEIRGFVGIVSRKRETRFMGPFEVEGYEGQVLLVEDVTSLLKIGATQVRKRIRDGYLKAWKPPEFLKMLGKTGSEVILRTLDGHELPVSRYWIVDYQSAVDMANRRDGTGRYNLVRQGRPRSRASNK